jgi:hypothetical protein
MKNLGPVRFMTRKKDLNCFLNEFKVGKSLAYLVLFLFLNGSVSENMENEN